MILIIDKLITRIVSPAITLNYVLAQAGGWPGYVFILQKFISSELTQISPKPV